MNFSRHWKIDAASLAIILGLGAIAYFVQISPTLEHHEQSKVQAAELATRQTEARDMEHKMFTLKDQVATAQAQAASSQLKLLPASQLNQRLAQLTDMAAKNSLQVDAVESGETKNFDRYSTIVLRLSGRGSYRNCTQMLKQLRDDMPDVGVTSVQMAAAGGTTDTTATFSFEMLWHTQLSATTIKKK